MKEKKIGIAFAANTNKFIPEAVRRDPNDLETSGNTKDSKGLTVSHILPSLHMIFDLCFYLWVVETNQG